MATRSRSTTGPTLSRRSLVQASAGITAGAAAMIARVAAAQEATPAATPGASPAASPVAGAVTRSITREAYLAQIAETFPLEAPATMGGQLIQGAEGDLSTLNPNMANDTFSLFFCMNIFNALTKTGVIDGTDAPDLADFWEVSADYLTYTFHLNPNATWHDGTPLTAADAVFTYESILAEESLSVKTAEVRQIVKGFRAVDDHTFELTAIEPSPVFVLKATNMVYIMPKHIWESVPLAEWPSTAAATGQDPTKVIGSGPFMFREWVVGDHATMVKNPTFWLPDEVPYLDEVIVRLTPEPAAATQALVSGEVDWLTLDASQYGTIEPMADQFNLVTWDSLAQLSFWMNLDPNRTPLFQDRRVRQALMYGIDRDLAAEQIFNGLATRADGVQPKLSTAYDGEQVNIIYTYDQAKAAALLDEAGWIDTDGDGIRDKDGVKFSFEYLYYQDDQLVPYFQEEFAKLGLELRASKIPFETMIDQLMAGTFDVLQVGWGWTNPDGDQGTLYRCDAAVPNGNNITRYCNPEYDRLNDLQLREMDPAKRKQLLVDQSNIVNEDVPFAVLFFLKLAAATQPTVHNYLPNGYLSWWSLNKMWKDAI